MSKYLSAAAQQEFDDEVLHEYQTMGGLRDCVTVRNGVVGDQYKFRRMGKGMANQKASQEDVTPMNVSHALIPCSLTNWNAPEYTDIFDAAEVNFDEQQELAQTIAGALGRRLDQLIIDAMNSSSSYAGTVTTDIGGTGTPWNTAKLRRAARYLNDKGVGMGDRYVAMTAQGLEDMLGQTESTNSDYNTVKALVNGEIDSFVGFKFKIIETRDEGGLPKPSTQTSFAWHKSAIGLAIGIDVRTEVNYIAQKTSWLANGLMKAGACVRNPNGLVKINTTET